MTAPKGQDPVAAAAAGDREALASLWREHRRWVGAVLLAHLPPGADLEDLLQEVAIAVVQHLKELREPEKLRPWLRSVAVNTAASAARKEEVRRRVLRPLGEGEQGGPVAQDGRQEQAADARRVLEMAQNLPTDYREPLLLRCVQGLSQRSIAEVLGMPETTVETRLARARRLLREALERDQVGPAPSAPPQPAAALTRMQP
ncbi:MAG: sigma-70 family RNA polymerase sigma factor [Planctomycetota bacterium]|nr:MAG: sigma-70 family RNA polymerase sigma factor [Planctomycetota bacterium]